MSYQEHFVEFGSQMERLKQRVSRLEMNPRSAVVVVTQESVAELARQSEKPYERCLQALGQACGDFGQARQILADMCDETIQVRTI